MTCRKADKLMQDVLNGEVDEDCALGFEEHLSDCERCADAWHAVWQVRSMLRECEPPNPGEAYLQQATTRIMDRVAAIQTQNAPAEEPPIISTTRYGPLPVRGAGAAFVFALGVFVGSLFPAPGEARTPSGAGVRHAGWVPARAFHPSADHGWAFPGSAAYCHAHGNHDHGPSIPANTRANMPNRSGALVTDEGLLARWRTPPPMIPSPQPAMSR